MQIPDARRRTVIFLHVPKSAGSTLHAVLARIYPTETVFDIPGPMTEREKTFAGLTPEGHERIRLVKGHVLYGIHRLVPRPYTYITILRHPVERVISHYYFVKRRPRHRLFEKIASSGMSLEEYALGGTALELDNGQVRALYGDAHLKVGYGACSRDMLEAALDHLETDFSVVGIAERFDESLLLMAHRLRWKRRPYYVRHNVTKNRPALAGVDAELIRTIEARNALDMELYESAVRRFDHDVQRIGVIEELPRFQRWNDVYGYCAAPIAGLHSRLSYLNGRRTQRSNA